MVSYEPISRNVAIYEILCTGISIHLPFRINYAAMDVVIKEMIFSTIFVYLSLQVCECAFQLCQVVHY